MNNAPEKRSGATVIEEADSLAVMRGADVLAQPPESHSSRRRWRFTERHVYVWASVVFFIGLWEVASRLEWIRPLFFSSPSEIVATAFREVTTGDFWYDVQVSMLAFVAGFSLAILLAIPLGLMLGWFRPLGHFFDPWLRFFYSTPRITYIPLLVLWFGLGLQSKIALVFAGPFITILVGTLEGVRTVPNSYLDVSRSFGAGGVQFFKSVLLPATVPFILASTRLALGIGIVAIVLGEMYASQAGIGHMLMQAANNLQANRVLFAVLILTLLGVGLSKILLTIEARVADWKPQN
jgi:ABC-type nitrate/sulfonate/bicarbonate transport system permease component